MTPPQDSHLLVHTPCRNSLPSSMAGAWEGSGLSLCWQMTKTKGPSLLQWYCMMISRLKGHSPSGFEKVKLPSCERLTSNLRTPLTANQRKGPWSHKSKKFCQHPGCVRKRTPSSSQDCISWQHWDFQPDETLSRGPCLTHARLPTKGNSDLTSKHCIKLLSLINSTQ